MLKHLARSAFLTLFLISCVSRAAETIEFPDEELATESVLPVFDLNISVRGRLVQMSKRWEFGFGFGYSLLEPFFNPYGLSGNLTYQWNEEQGVNLWTQFFMPGTSDYTNQLNPIPGTGIYANIQYAPAPTYIGILSYQYSAWYGKISLSKNYVMRLSLFGLAGLGMIGVGDSSNMLGSFGFGERFFFGDSWNLRADMRFYLYQGPDVLSRNLQSATSTQSASTFSTKLNFGTVLGLTLAYMFK